MARPKFNWRKWKPTQRENKKIEVIKKEVTEEPKENRFNANKDIREQMWDFLNPLQK